MAKLISISLLDEEISAERLMDALNKLSSRDLRKYFKRKKMFFPRNVRYAFLTKCIKRDFLAVQKDLLDSDNRVFTEFELVEFYKCVENEVLAKEFKKDFLSYFVSKTYKTLLTDKNLADLYSLAEAKEETTNESIYGFLVGLNSIFTDTEENNLDCLPVETTAQRLKDQFTLFEVREFAKKYGVIIPKYPKAELIAPIIVEKVETRQLLDEEGLANLQGAESNVLLSFAKKHGIYAPRYLKKDEMIDEVISQISRKEIDNNRISEVFNENLITFKSRSSNLTLCDLLDKYQNLDDLSEIRNDNSKDMSPLKRCAVGGAIGLELRYNELNRKERLLERRKKLEILRQQALERKEQLLRERKEQALLAQSEESAKLAGEEEAKRIAAEQRVAELEAALKEEEAKRLAAEKALEELNKNLLEEVNEEEVETDEVDETETVGDDELVVPEYVETTVQEPYEVEETRDVTYMAFETLEEDVTVPSVVEEPVVEESTEEVPTEEQVVEEPTEEEPQPEPVKCPIKKMHKFGWIASIVAIVLVACLSLFVFGDSFKRIFNNDATLVAKDYLSIFGIFFVTYGFLAFVIRVIFHKFRCKAKKGVACCKTKEVYKYLWTRIIVLAVSAVILSLTKLLHFATIKDSIWTVIKDKIFGAEGLSSDGAIAKVEALLILLVVFFAAYLLTLLVLSIVHTIKCRKGCKQGLVRQFIIYSWSLMLSTVVVFGVLIALNSDVMLSMLNIVLENVKLVLPFNAVLIVNAASGETVGNSEPDFISYIFFVIALLVVIYLLSLIVLTLGYSSHVKKQKTKVAAIEDVPSEEIVVTEQPITEEVKEEEERLLFTTFEEAKLVEDLNDLNRMIGKVNEHVKDLSAIQARLYNELVGEEEIIIEPDLENTHIVIPETPTETPTLVAEEPSEETKTEEKTEEKVEEEIKEEKVEKEKIKCPVRKVQKIWLMIMVVLLAAMGVCYALDVLSVQAFVIERIDFYCSEPLTKWVTTTEGFKPYLEILYNYGILFGALLFVTLVVSFLVRVLLHPIGCKAKKHKHCCLKCEWHKFVWTVIFIGFGLVALLSFVPLKGYNFGFDKILDKLLHLGTLDFKNPETIVLVSGAGLFVLGFIILTIVTFVHLSKDNRRAAALLVVNQTNEGEENSQNQTPTTSFQEGVAYLPYMLNGNIQLVPVAMPVAQQPQVAQANQLNNGIQPIYIYSQMANNATAGNHVATYANPYCPGIYEDIDSPYNMYRIRENAPTSYRSRRGLGFLKFLGALLVLVAAYVFLAYKIEAIDFLGIFH